LENRLLLSFRYCFEVDVALGATEWFWLNGVKPKVCDIEGVFLPRNVTDRPEGSPAESRPEVLICALANQHEWERPKKTKIG
jgi:hypothetical protein